MPKINDALLAGRTMEAEELWQNHIRGDDWFITPFSRLGSLNLTFDPRREVSNYRRELDIEQSEFRVEYEVDYIVMKRQMFLSSPDKVMVKRISSNKKGKVTVDINLDIDPGCSPEIEISQQDIILKARNLSYGKLDGVLTVAARIRVMNKGGTVSLSGNTIKVKNADEVTLLLAAETSYLNFKQFDRDPVDICRQRIDKASRFSFSKLRRRHLEDYQSFFKRFELEMGGESLSHLPTDERVQLWRKTIDSGETSSDLQLLTMFSQMARYIWISCSRPGTQPMTVVGLWNERPKARWGGVWANNINGPQLYWGVEETNLSEMHQPWLQMVSELTENGQKSAQTTFGLPGWTVFLRTDVWRYTSLEAEKTHNAFPQAGPWLCHHLWEHYLFTGDKGFLKQAYPVMKGSAEFYMNYMVRDPETGQWLAGPSASPEWGPIALGVTVSQMLAWDLFGNCIQAAEALETDAEFSAKLAQRMKDMASLEISEEGHLPEWRLSTDMNAGAKSGDNSANASYRHMSHLYALAPAAQINPIHTPQLAAAMRKSLSSRGFREQSFTGARRIISWARLYDAERAYKKTLNYMRFYTLENMVGNAQQLDDKNQKYVMHMEASTAFTAGICEMLLQSHAGEVYLLPAWPGKWDEGSVKGLRARGGFGIDIHWRNGNLLEATVHSTIGGVIRVRANVPVELKKATSHSFMGEEVPNPLLKVISWKSPDIVDPTVIEEIELPKSYLLQFETEPGKEYLLINSNSRK